MVTLRCGNADRLGVLGGTFDPLHCGHLALAEAGRDQLGLGCVLFVPAGDPPHKPSQPMSSAQHRGMMVAMVVGDYEGYTLSRADLDRPGPHYTADLLAILRHTYPNAELYFLMGSDSLRQFPAWHHPARIVAQARLAVLRRPNWEADVQALEWAVPGIREHLVWLEGAPLDISGTDIRRRVREGLPIGDLVPPSIEAYIHKHDLYRDQQGR